MRLELHWVRVEEMRHGTTTRLVDNALELGVPELCRMLEADAHLQRVRLDIVYPGESCRIGRVFDVIAPRAKVEGGEDFPGVLGKVTPAGSGRTVVLVTDGGLVPQGNPGGSWRGNLGACGALKNRVLKRLWRDKA